MIPRSKTRQVGHTVTPKKSSFKLFRKIRSAKNRRTPLFSHYFCQICRQISSYWKLPPPLYPSVSYPISTYQSQAQILQTQTKQQQLNTQTLLQYSGLIANPTIQPPTMIPALPRALKTELIYYSNTPRLSTLLI